MSKLTLKKFKARTKLDLQTAFTEAHDFIEDQRYRRYTLSVEDEAKDIMKEVIDARVNYFGKTVKNVGEGGAAGAVTTLVLLPFLGPFAPIGGAIAGVCTGGARNDGSYAETYGKLETKYGKEFITAARQFSQESVFLYHRDSGPDDNDLYPVGN